MARSVVFWQNIASFHQSSYIRSLAKDEGFGVTVAVADMLPAEHIRAGWATPEFAPAKLVRIQPKQGLVDQVNSFGLDAYHIFSGFRLPVVRDAFRICARRGLQTGVLAEACDPQGFQGLARLVLYKYLAARYSARIQMILAMGGLGVEWYEKCGFPCEKIYPFAYFVERPEGSFLSPGNDEEFDIAFVGRLIPRKRVDLLLMALAELRNLSWRLTLVGDGPEEDRLKQLAGAAGVSDRVDFLGALPNTEATEVIGSADILVLPSRYDGWGAVVNEALMQGVPVICSDGCGAADLLDGEHRGAIFRSGDTGELRRVLESWMARGKRTRESTERILKWSRAIEGAAGAHYFAEVLNASRNNLPKPVVPWLE